MSRRALLIIGLSLVAFLIIFGLITLLLLQDGSCGQGSFQCSNDTMCVPQKGMCDGHIDCPQGDDEDYFLCVDFHGSNSVLDGFLKMAFPPIQTLDSAGANSKICGLQNYPKFCKCEYETNLYCKNLKLQVIPEDLQPPDKIKKLILANNSITEINNTTLVHYNLILLNLENNKIVRIPNGVFKNQNLLRKLWLSHNVIEDIDSKAFEGLSSLKWLFLNQNQIQDFDLNSMAPLQNLEWLDLSANLLKLDNMTFPAMMNLKELMLEDNQIEIITEFTISSLSSLTYLSLRNNRITEIHARSFWNLHNLLELDLSNNRIITLPSGLFDSCTFLNSLSLGHNKVLQIPWDIFVPVKYLKSLNLEDIDLSNIEIEMFEELHNLTAVYFSSFHYCTYVPQARKCKPNNNGLSSTENLLENVLLRFGVWLIGIFSLIGNAIVLLTRSALKRENGTLAIFVQNLAAADILMSFYLLVIAGQDIQYRDHYHQLMYKWMSSNGCTFIGVMATVSSEASLLILTFMSTERFLCIAAPFANWNISHKFAQVAIIILWALSLLIALIPVFYWHHSTHFYGSNGLCFPLHLDDSLALGWQYSALVFLGINSICVLVIVFCYGCLFVSIHRTRCATPLAVKEFDLAIRFFFIVFTNCLCWAPIFVIKIIILAQQPIKPEVSAWVMVFVLPINSALNPFIYTFTTSKFKTIVCEVVRRNRFLRRLEESSLASSLARRSRPTAISALHRTATSRTIAETRHTRNAPQAVHLLRIDPVLQRESKV